MFLSRGFRWKIIKKIYPRRFGSKTSNENTNVEIPAPEPGKIQAAVLKEFSKPLVIENIQPIESIKQNQVLIDVHYCALNGPDVLLMKNFYRKKLDLPKVLGYEFAGKILELSDEAKQKGFKIGDKVVALNKNNYGGLAEQCVAETMDIWKIPSSVKMMDTICLLDNYLIALIALEKKAELQEDEIVLINVGLGGIGLAAVDIAANVFKAQVIGVSASEDRTTIVRDKGAFSSLKYKDKKLMNKIKEFAAERDIKDVFDGDEGEKFKKMLDCFTSIYKEDNKLSMLREDNFAVLVEHLSREGRIIVTGFAMTKSDDIKDDSENCPFSISGINLKEFKEKYSEDYREAGNDILQYFEEGLIKPTCSIVTGLYKINDAVNFINDLKCTGKVIIDIKNRDFEMTRNEK